MLPILWNWLSRLFVIVGLCGVISFFPVSKCHQHTCLFEHLMTDCKSGAEHSSMAELLRHYLLPYGLLWWLSIAMTTLAIVYIVRQHRHENFQRS